MDTAAPHAEQLSGDLDNPRLYVNAELSWLRFNERVLDEALNERNHLLERVKFLAIFSNNLDEFFMVRVSGLQRQLKEGVASLPPDGLTPVQQLARIRERVLPMLTVRSKCWLKDLLPKLRQASINILNYEELKGKQRRLLRRYFQDEIFPVLTPLAFDPGHPFPHISSLSMNLAVVVQDPLQGVRFARLKVPATLPRLLRIPSEENADEGLGLNTSKSNHFVWIEQVIKANLDLLFPGLDVRAAYAFRVIRDADMDIQEDEASDLLSSVRELVGQRGFGSAVALEIDDSMPEDIRQLLSANLRLAPYQVYTVSGPTGLAHLAELASIDRPDLKDATFLAAVPEVIERSESIFAALRNRTVSLYHPYDSFAPVVEFVRQAAHDPDVLAIKQTLYRVGQDSPIVQALLEARSNGKQVAVLVELKARFDEENNIGWAQTLERNGVHVTYGLVGLKTHCKMCLVVRKEPDGIVRYVHLSTGNYNASTARVYADIGYFTTDPDISSDVSDLFNALTGYSRKNEYRKILVAPGAMRDQLLMRIQREIDRQHKHGDGYLAFKMNSLVDKPCIAALYRASQAGVKVDLQVRGICCLRPQIPGVSDNITVTSIVGRFLEHARMYYFRNGGDDELWLGSADLMPRNLDRRVEILYPIGPSASRRSLVNDILMVHLRDTSKARRMLADGSYERIKVKEGDQRLNSQSWLIETRGKWHHEDL